VSHLNRPRGLLAAIVAVLAAAVAVLVLPAAAASAAGSPAAGTRVGASNPGMILTIGVSHTVSAGEGRGGGLP